MADSQKKLESTLGSLPVPLRQRTWGAWVAVAVCLSFAIGSWSFVVAGSIGNWLDAKSGTAAMIAGALIAQLLLTLSQIRVASRHGLETVTTTKPQLGVRGSFIALAMQFITEVGWSAVLLIFLGRAIASVLVSLGTISESSHATVSAAISALGAVLVWVLLQAGSKALKYAGPIATIVVFGVGAWMMFVLFDTHGADAIFSAAPLDPLPDLQTNYSLGVEMLAISTISWWASMGGVFRMVKSPRKSVVPSMLGLGAGWAIFGLISLYSALALSEADPTVWMLQLAGPIGGVITLLMVAFANLGSTLTMCYVGALGLGQVPSLGRRFGWKTQTGLLVVPVIVIVIFFPAPFYDQISSYIGFLGAILAPMVGIQIVDWYVLKRELHISSLFRHDPRSAYWYRGGVNYAGVIGLIVGCLTYVLLLNPITFVPQSEIFKYTTAFLPAVIIGGSAYLLATKALHIRAGTPSAADEDPNNELEEQR